MSRFLPQWSVVLIYAALLCGIGTAVAAAAAQSVRVTVHPSEVRQEFQGLGCGVQFYEGHITSFAARHKDEKQRHLYDDMFAKVPTRYLNLMIRPEHQPNDNGGDPWNPSFDPKDFAYCEHTLAIAGAARERQPDIEFLATLGTPPAWMKTNNNISGGGKAKATLKPGFELKFAAYIWGFLAHMARNGEAVKYVAISNECDWPHDQPGCFFTPEAHAKLFATVGDYLQKMAAKYPDVPRAILVGPNTLSAPDAVKAYIPAMERTARKYVQVLAAHDYDPRGDRWGDMRRLAGTRPVWMTEWCARDTDDSPGQIHNAIEYARAMHEAFTGGANVWMAYDWAYPPRRSGEALIQIDWGNDYTLIKPYWVFRQWATQLVPGMHVVRCSAAAGETHSGAATATSVQPTAFVSKDHSLLVVHVLNASDDESPIVLAIEGLAHRKSAARQRTSATQDMEELTPLDPAGPAYADLLPPRSLTTYRFELK